MIDIAAAVISAWRSSKDAERDYKGRVYAEAIKATDKAEGVDGQEWAEIRRPHTHAHPLTSREL